MGKSMAGHLMHKGGYKLSVYNRTSTKAQDLINNGAVFKTPKEIAQESDYLFLMLGHPHDVEDMCLNKQEGLL